MEIKKLDVWILFVNCLTLYKCFLSYVCLFNLF